MSTSRGALIYLACIVVLFFYLRKLRRTKNLLQTTAISAAIGVPIVCLVFSRFNAITSAMGRHPEMTGRIPMWIFSALFALKPPWWGYGYNAFWRGADGPSV